MSSRRVSHRPKRSVLPLEMERFGELAQSGNAISQGELRILGLH
jgi:hypothetical protein